MERRQSRARAGRPSAEVVDFDEALLATFPAEFQAELRAEAEMLSCALIQAGCPAELEGMADALCRNAGETAGDVTMDRRRARGLAAAIRLLVRRGGG